MCWGPSYPFSRPVVVLCFPVLHVPCHPLLMKRCVNYTSHFTTSAPTGAPITSPTRGRPIKSIAHTTPHCTHLLLKAGATSCVRPADVSVENGVRPPAASECPEGQVVPDCDYIRSNAADICATPDMGPWHIVNGPNCRLSGSGHSCKFTGARLMTGHTFCCPLGEHRSPSSRTHKYTLMMGDASDLTLSLTFASSLSLSLSLSLSHTHTHPSPLSPALFHHRTPRIRRRFCSHDHS